MRKYLKFEDGLTLPENQTTIYFLLKPDYLISINDDAKNRIGEDIYFFYNDTGTKVYYLQFKFDKVWMYRFCYESEPVENKIEGEYHTEWTYDQWKPMNTRRARLLEQKKQHELSVKKAKEAAVKQAREELKAKEAALAALENELS